MEGAQLDTYEASYTELLDHIRTALDDQVRRTEEIQYSALPLLSLFFLLISLMTITRLLPEQSDICIQYRVVTTCHFRYSVTVSVRKMIMVK